jgi:hypothetical protein
MSKWLAVLGWVALLAGAARADDFSCPAEIQTEQSAPKPPQGWTAFVDKVNARHWLMDVGFYDGPPVEMVGLKQESEDDTLPATWTFEPRKEGRHIWQVCTYGDTSVMLSRPLPDGIKTCRATYEYQKGYVPVKRHVRAVTCR